MTLVSFEPRPGLVTDETEYAAKGAWSDCSNVRFHKGRPQAVGQYKLLSSAIGGVPRDGVVLTLASGTHYLCIGTTTHLYAFGIGSETLTDITPASGYSADDVIFDTYGGTLIVCEVGGNILQWDGDVGTNAANISNAPTQNSCVLVTPERQILVGGTREEVANSFNGMCIRGSDIEDPTDWITSADNNAFEHILEGRGRIVRLLMVGSYVAVLTSNGLHMGQFIGDPAQTYRFEPVAEGCGLVAPHAVQVVDATLYWYSPKGLFFRWTPGGLPEVVSCPIIDELGNITSTTICLGMHRSFEELWFFYRSGTGENTKYAAMSLIDGSWFKGNFGRNSWTEAPVQEGVFACGSDGKLYRHENRAHESDGSSVTYPSWSLTSADFPLQDAIGRRMMIRGVYPDFEDQGSTIELRVLTRDYPQGAQVTTGPFDLDQGDTKADFRASGRLMAVKLSAAAVTSSDGAHNGARLGTLTLDLVPLGAR